MVLMAYNIRIKAQSHHIKQLWSENGAKFTSTKGKYFVQNKKF